MDNKIVKQVIKVVKKAIKAALIPILIPLICVVLVLILLSACVYFITEDDGTYKKDDWSNTMYAARQYTNGVTVGEDGMLTSQYTPQELWNKLKEKNSRVLAYLKDEKELAKLMNAEIITQYPDTRVNPDAKINWNNILSLDNENLQGIIKFKRNTVEGNYSLTEQIMNELKNEYSQYEKEEASKKAEEKKEKEEEKKVNSNNKEKYEYSITQNEDGSYNIGSAKNLKVVDSFNDIFKQYAESGEKITIKWVGYQRIQVGKQQFYKPEYNLSFEKVENIVYSVEGVQTHQCTVNKNSDGSYRVGNAVIVKNNNFSKYQFQKFVDDQSKITIAVDENRTYKIGTAEIKKGEVNYNDAKEVYERVHSVPLNEDNTNLENNQAQENTNTSEETISGSGFEKWLNEKGYIKDSTGAWKPKSKTITMTYVDPQTFRNYINEYKNTGTEQAREQALSHFTIEKNTASSSGNAVKSDSLKDFLFIGDSLTVGLSQASLNDSNKQALSGVTYRAEVGKAAKYWLDNFSQLPDAGQVKGVSVLLGVNNPTDKNNMKTLIDKLTEKYSNTNIYVQKVFPVGLSYTYNSSQYMNEQISSYNKEIQEYCNQKENVHFIDTTLGYIGSDGYLSPDMSSADGLHFAKYDKWAENIVSEIVGTTSSESNKSSNSTSSDNLDVDPNVNSEPYTSLNPFAQAGLRGQCTWFAWGKFYEIYGYDPGFRGNGCTNAEELVAKHRR